MGGNFAESARRGRRWTKNISLNFGCLENIPQGVIGSNLLMLVIWLRTGIEPLQHQGGHGR